MMRGIGKRTLRGAASVAALVVAGSAAGGVLSNVDTTRLPPGEHAAAAGTGALSATRARTQRHAQLASAVRYPASYFRGPLGKLNPLPPKPGAFLIAWHGRHSWGSMKAGILERHRAMGRRFDGIATAYVPSERREPWIHKQGALPIIAGWTPGGSAQDIASGARDRAIVRFARHLRRYPFLVMVRMFHEFDQEHLDYHACGEAFIAMWRRVVTLVHHEGVRNVGFWWSPSEGYGRNCTRSSYPGDAYVDWVGADTYNHCFVGETHCFATPYRAGWAEFGELFDYDAGLANLTTQHDQFGPRKPFVIGETGTVYDPSNPSRKGDWYRNVVAAAKKMEYLRGVTFFDADASPKEGARNNWHVDHPRTDPGVYQGFLDMASHPWFNTRRTTATPLGSFD